MTNEELMLERLARIEARLEGVDRVEQQMAAFTGPWENLSDLGRDLSLLMDPAVRRLTEEMVEVEIGFQLEDFFALIKRALAQPEVPHLVPGTAGKPRRLVARHGTAPETGGAQADRLPG